MIGAVGDEHVAVGETLYAQRIGRLAQTSVGGGAAADLGKDPKARLTLGSAPA